MKLCHYVHREMQAKVENALSVSCKQEVLEGLNVSCSLVGMGEAIQVAMGGWGWLMNSHYLFC